MTTSPTSSGQEFWEPYLRDERPFAELVRQGIRISDRLDWISGMGMKPSYGKLSAGKAGRLFAQWQSDPARFEAERPKTIVDAVLEWGHDARADEIHAQRARDRLMSRLPTPPPGYFWHRVFGCLVWDLADSQFRLWSHELGYPPHEGG